MKKRKSKEYREYRKIKKEKKKLFDRINICKYGMVVVLVIYIGILVFVGRDSRTPFETVEKAVLTAADLSGMEEADTVKIRKYYGLNEKDYEGVLLYTSGDAMGVEELFLIRVKDDAQMEEVLQSIDDRISTQLNNFEGYGAEQTKLLKQAITDQRGKYVLMVISQNAVKFQQAYIDAL
ncbi:MAG: DUF4358 domain-containing protein [Lachnoclostridium sp.]